VEDALVLWECHRLYVEHVVAFQLQLAADLDARHQVAGEAVARDAAHDTELVDRLGRALADQLRGPLPRRVEKVGLAIGEDAEVLRRGGIVGHHAALPAQADAPRAVRDVVEAELAEPGDAVAGVVPRAPLDAARRARHDFDTDVLHWRWRLERAHRHAAIGTE